LGSSSLYVTVHKQKMKKNMKKRSSEDDMKMHGSSHETRSELIKKS
jgi:hypothetical protein